MSVVVVADHLRGRLRDTTFELITAARRIGGPVSVAVIAPDPSALDVRREGVDEIIHVPVESREFDPDTYAGALEALIDTRKPDAVLLGFTVNSMAYAPMVAVRRRLGFASDVFALAHDDGVLVATRSFYGGKVHGEIDFPEAPCVLLLLRPATWSPSPAEPALPAETTVLRISSPPPRVRHKAFVEPVVDDLDVAGAQLVVAAGRGVDSEERIGTLQLVAERLGGVLAASRPIVDAGWLPRSRLVGVSGTTVRPKVYLALGISGSSQHVAAIKGSGTIIAVNVDPDAEIFDIAQYGAIAGLEAVAEELARLV
jgi:electron transfer flavoprotein alpha subunit